MKIGQPVELKVPQDVGLRNIRRDEHHEIRELAEQYRNEIVEEKSDYDLLKFIKKYLERLEDGNSTIWRFGREFNYKHPTQKPIQLILKAIFNSSRIDDLVLDLFLGSGSTLIACEKTNRICFGCEIDPKYCDTIIKRYEDFTGLKASKVS